MLPRRDRVNLYYDHLRQIMGEAREVQVGGSLVGGCVLLADDGCCWYRLYDGGRDRSGRPGRRVCLCAITPRQEQAGLDCSGILDSPVFQSFVAQAHVQPLPQPADLALPWEGRRLADSEIAQAMGTLRAGHAVQIRDGDAAGRLGAAVGALAAGDAVFHGRLLRSGDAPTAILELKSADARKEDSHAKLGGTGDAIGGTTPTGKKRPDAEGTGGSRRDTGGKLWQSREWRRWAIVVAACVVCLVIGFVAGWLLARRQYNRPAATQEWPNDYGWSGRGILVPSTGKAVDGTRAQQHSLKAQNEPSGSTWWPFPWPREPKSRKAMAVEETK
jgi:hypothetical protein